MATLVSIGMPVYNEEKFIRQSLDALLSQTFKNINIIICDNASTDNTSTIIHEYMDNYNNIKYYRETKNKGSLYNFKKAFERSDSKYFMWASGHDLWSSNLVETIIERLELSPNASIGFATTIWIDENNSEAQRQSGWIDTRGMHPVERFFSTIWGNVHPILGVMRSKDLRTARFINTVGTDLIILAGMALKGDFLHIPESTCYRRELNIRANESQQARFKRYNNKDFMLSSGVLSKLLPLLHLPIELMFVILKSELTILEKTYLLFAAFPTFLIKYLVAKKK